jgi:hypothetical protein
VPWESAELSIDLIAATGLESWVIGNIK